jgi:hypothetical protein
MSIGGLVQTSDWWYKNLKGNSSYPWQRAGRDSTTAGGSLFEFLSNTHNFETFEKSSTGPLRGSADWEKWIASRLYRIRPGDVVFYHDSTKLLSWIHAAMVTVDFGQETNYLAKNSTGNRKPLIVEHTGPLQYAGLPAAERSIDDTDNAYISSIAIVYMKELR